MLVNINVYGINSDQEVFPLRIWNKVKQNHFDLFFITENTDAGHYCYIN